METQLKYYALPKYGRFLILKEIYTTEAERRLVEAAARKSRTQFTLTGEELATVKKAFGIKDGHKKVSCVMEAGWKAIWERMGQFPIPEVSAAEGVSPQTEEAPEVPYRTLDWETARVVSFNIRGFQADQAISFEDTVLIPASVLAQHLGYARPNSLFRLAKGQREGVDFDTLRGYNLSKLKSLYDPSIIDRQASAIQVFYESGINDILQRSTWTSKPIRDHISREVLPKLGQGMPAEAIAVPTPSEALRDRGAALESPRLLTFLRQEIVGVVKPLLGPLLEKLGLLEPIKAQLDRIEQAVAHPAPTPQAPEPKAEPPKRITTLTLRGDHKLQPRGPFQTLDEILRSIRQRLGPSAVVERSEIESIINAKGLRQEPWFRLNHFNDETYDQDAGEIITDEITRSKVSQLGREGQYIKS